MAKPKPGRELKTLEEVRAYLENEQRSLTPYVSYKPVEGKSATHAHIPLAKIVDAPKTKAVYFEPDPSEHYVSNKLLRKISAEAEREGSPFNALTAAPSRHAFVNLDICRFSQLDPLQQLVVVQSLIECTSSKYRAFFNQPPGSYDDLEASLCSGDGYIYVFKDAMSAAWFAAALAVMIEMRGARGYLPVPFRYRMGVHVGDVYRFHDPERTKPNFIGAGINESNRIVNVIDKDHEDVVFMSRQALDDIMNRPSSTTRETIMRGVSNRGRRKDKHDKWHHVYEMNHVTVAEKAITRCERFFPSPALSKAPPPAPPLG